MTDIGTLEPRKSALPWALYQSENYVPLSAARDHDGLYVGMLKEDLQKQRYAYDVSLIPQRVEWTRASEVIAALLSDFNRTGYHSDPAELVLDFGGSLIDESVDGKEMLLELHASPAETDPRSRPSRRTDSSEQQHSALPSLGFIPRWSVTSHRSGLSQVAPERGRPAVVIQSSRIQTIRLRKENERRWQQTIRGLRQVDTADIGGHDLARLSWRGYAFSEQLAVQNLAIAATTASIGWDARGTFSDSVTSPYQAYRRLRFVQFWVEAIEDSVAFLNQFTKSEPLYGPDAFTFSLSGLPSAKDLTEAMSAIRRGSLTAEEAQNIYFFPRHAKLRSERSDGQ